MKFKLYDYENDRSTDIELTPSQWKELQAFLKELKNPPTHDYKAVLDCFNRICSKLPPATRLTDKRRRAIVKAQKDGYDLEQDRKSTRLNSSHANESRMPSSA